jgi:putative transposase
MLIHDPATGDSYFSKRRKWFDHDRMPRELTFSCFQRLPLLNRDRTRQWFVDELDRVRGQWPIDLWAWVIMPEHVHLLVAPRETGVDVGRMAGVIKERTAKRAIVWLETNAPTWVDRLTVREGRRIRRRFWQPGGGYDRNINDAQTLAHVINYIHANPVKRDLAATPADWPWSSAQWYAGVRPAILEMDALPTL